MEKGKQKYISFFLPSLQVGGIERVFITYANKLIDLSYKVDFIICKGNGDLEPLLSPKINLYIFNCKLRYSYNKLYKYIKGNRPNVIITGGDYANIMLIVSSFFLKKYTKIIISQHNYFNIEITKLGFWAKGTRLWMKLLYPYANHIIAVSEDIKNYLIHEINLNKRKISCINNPINISELLDKSSENININLPNKFIVFIGRLSPVKNLSLLLYAFDLIDDKDLHLVIVGNGSEMHNLIKITNNLKNRERILFTGSINNPLPILNKSDLLVLPSLSEAYPTILLEAICLNKKILSTPTKGALDILKNNPNTYITKSFYDAVEVANHIQILLKKSVYYPDNNLVDKYNIDTVITKMKKIF